MVKSSSGTDKVVVDDDGTMSVTNVSLAEHTTEADKVLHPLTVGNTTLNSKAVSFDGSQTKSVDLQSLATYTSGISDFDDIKDSKIIGINGASGYANSPKSQVSYYDTINWGTLLSVKGSHPDGYDTMQFLSGNSSSQNLYFRTGFPDYPLQPIWFPWCNVITDLNSAINPNIAINYDFRNPVNQRGQTSYTGTGYCIDDWYLKDSDAISATLEEEGLHIVSTDTTSNRYYALNQRIEFPRSIIGKTVTFSIFISQNNNIINGTYNSIRCGVVWSNGINYNSSQFIRIYIPAGYTGLLTSTAIVPNNISNYSGINIECFHNESGTTGNKIDMTISAVKLELGPRQTLARRNSSGQWEICDVTDYGEQLAKCQRYFQNLNLYKDAYAYYGCGAYTNSTRAYIIVPLSVSLRSKPSINWNGNITLFNTNYYGVKNILIDRIGANNVSLAIDSENLVANSYYSCFSRNDVNSYIYLNAQL